MGEDHRKNHRNRKNDRNHHNGRNKNGQRNQRNEDKEQSNKKVPMKYQIRNSKDAGSVEFKYEIDGITERTKINIYEDRNDEEYLKMTKEFQLFYARASLQYPAIFTNSPNPVEVTFTN